LEDSGAETIICLDILYEAVEKTGLALKHVILTNISEYLPKAKKLIGRSILSSFYQQMKTPSIDVQERQGFYSFQDLIGRYPPDPPKVDLRPKDDLATLHYTGGTTGQPKGVMLTHSNMMAGLIQNLALYPFLSSGEETYIAYMPLYHIAGQAQITCSIGFGWTAVIFTTPDVEEILSAISIHKASIFIGAPTMFEVLRVHEKAGRVNWRKLKLLIGGADTLHENTVREWKRRTGSDITEVYGMTEGMGVTHANPIHKTKINSFGIPIPNTLAAVADTDQDNFVPVGDIGELVVKGPQIMAGYWNNREATRAVMSEIEGHTWYRTGDLVRMDDEGYFYFYDRKRDLIKYKGYRIYARETEEIVKSHPQVKEVGVVGVPDVRVGEYVKAFVVLESEARGRLSEAEIKDFCKGKVAPYKIPTRIEFVGEIPKTDVGKVSRRELREEFDHADITASTPLLQVENLRKSFGGIRAVDDVSFEISKGEIVGLIGPNGSGKTTTIRAIMGILKPTAGTVKFKGKDITTLSTARVTNLGMAMTFQVIKPFRHLPVLYNALVSTLSSRAKRRGEWVKIAEERAKDALEFCGIGDMAQELASSLSHGDLKRLELARAIATEPELLLLDEPFGGLNPAETDLVSRSLRRLHKGGRFGRLHSEGPAMLIVEHKLAYLMKIVDRVIVLNFGKIIATGSPEEIVRDPHVIEAYIGKEVEALVSGS
jgi:long-chain acyl-CoA synthetase